MSGEKKRRRAQAAVDAVMQSYQQTGAATDPMGSYTGMTGETRSALADTIIPTAPVPGGKRWMTQAELTDAVKPEQDADDL
ncbi:MAG: hypothetical protein MJ175_06825 [Clostridia bacterium]|nr:hypothetical protein [Clostridia bacterium]